MYGPNVLAPSEMADHFFSSNNMIFVENGAMEGLYKGSKPYGGSDSEYYFYTY